MLELYMLIFMFMIGLLSFCYKNSHFLLMLLSLEFINLSLFFIIYLYLWTYMTEKFILMYYLTFCVCEGAFGLSLLVCMVRSFGNDYFNNLNFLKC